MSRRVERTAALAARALFWIGFPVWWVFRQIFAGVSQPLHHEKVKKSPRVKAKKTSSSDLFAYDWQSTWDVKRALQFEWYWRRTHWRSLLPKRRISFRTLWHVPGWLVWAALTLVFITGGSWYFYDQVIKGLPSPESIRSRQPIASTKIYDRQGRLLYTIFKDENRTIVPLTDISPNLIQATLAVEDADFYQHWGVSFKGIARAVWHNLRRETVQGGSTITQQLVKNVLLTPEKTWQRKAREAILAVMVDATYSKDEILYHYLNEVNYGGSVYGVEEASQWYFSKPAAQLSLGEAAFLAGLPVAPSAYSPFGPTPQRAYDRQKEVLHRMQEVGFISDTQRQSAEAEKLTFRTNTYDIEAPHFVMMVRSQLAQMFGEDMVSQGGLEVYTTLDLDVQASAEASVRQEVTKLQRLHVTNGAAMVTNPKSGEVLAMVGSKDYFDAQHDGSVNVTLRPRQPGSSIKPVTYSVAFERGYTPATQIADQPVQYTSPGSPPWVPKNYDGRFHGIVTLREALGSSYNIPAVRLLSQLGIDQVVQKGRDMGITTWDDASRFGLALTLGAGEVTMYDMTKVYGTFANGGLTVPLNPLMAVRSYDGKTLYSNPCIDAVDPCNARRTLTPLAAYEITSVLSDNAARTPAFGPHSVLTLSPQEVAVKTGTTNNLHDNWTFGYTDNRVVATWVGNNDNTPMSAVASGVTGASPIWHNIMASQLVATNLHHFVLPAGLTKVKICRQTGTLPCGECPQVSEEVFPQGLAPTQSCTAAMFTQAPDGDKRTAQGKVL